MPPTLKRRWFQFSLGGMFVVVTVFCVFLGWAIYQLNWIRQRAAWRDSGSGAMRSVQTQRAPGFLAAFGEYGESWIEIKNGTDEQIAEVKRLFPEATVVTRNQQPETTLVIPLPAPRAPQTPVPNAD
jgi:hypothetical protein